MSQLARLTHLSTETLTLLVERQRLETIGQPPPATSTSAIVRNLKQMRVDIDKLQHDGNTPANTTRVLRDQFERMRMMLGSSASEVQPLSPPPAPPKSPSPPPASKHAHSDSLHLPTKPYQPYRDDEDDEEYKDGFTPPFRPSVSPNPFDSVSSPAAEQDPEEMIQFQRQAMLEQDTQLDTLGDSIRRQRDLSMRIGDELEVHTGLLESLDSEVDHTTNRMTGARRRLDHVAQGARRNVSAITIGVLIFILLILIIVFKT
ncbi:hypothetical protein BKA62DRAFT_739258 [Auriculariales sp. MPI-PUGE-AT-0066]|nr:hypothetical protein BKA62DRAFT_739258 [Auriculariales sp. MPI-PUGE-AT-0066]